MARKESDYIDPKILPDDERAEITERINKAARGHPVVKVHHGRWKELIAWGDKGEQFSEYDDETGEVSSITHKFRKRKKTVVINLMKPLGEAIEGKINMFYRVNGFPNSSEQKDIEGSKVATKIHENIDYTNRVELLNDELKYDLKTTGNAYRKWIWDKDMVVAGEDGNLNGEIAGSVPSIFNIRPDPTARTREDMRWLIEIAEVPEDQLLTKFKITKEKLKTAIEERKKKGESPLRNKYIGMNEPIEEKEKEEPTKIIAYYWEKASDKYKEGRHIITLVDTNLVFWAKKNPALGEIPYFPYGYKRQGNSIWHSGPYHHVQDIQREINRMVSIISEHLEGWRAKMLVPEGSLIKAGSFTMDSFELLEWDPTRGEPKPANMPELSPQITAYRDFLMTAFNLVSNVHEVSYSQLPKYASRAPATLFSMMLEQENLKLDPMIARMNQTILDEAKFKLRLADKYYTSKRLIKILGTGKQSQVEYFKGADMRGNFDVKLEIGVSLNQSKTVQQRLLMELKQMGAPVEWNKIYKLLQEGDISEELRGDIADETKAIRENQAYMNDTYNKDRKEGGIMFWVHDDHDVHLGFHTNLMKSEEAHRWEPEKLLHLQQHIDQHFEKIQELKMAQAPMPGPPTTEGPEAPGAMPTPAEGGVAPEVGETRRRAMPA